MPKLSTRILVSLLILVVGVVIAACGGQPQQATAPKAAAPTTAPTAAPKATEAPKAAAPTTAPTAAPKATEAPKAAAPTAMPTAAPKATEAPKAAAPAPAPKLTSGSVLADGSSTVYPVTEAVAEEFQKANPGVRVTVGLSGTGGGFKKFCNNETDISNASRPISDAEKADCAKNNVEYVELQVAYDGLSLMVNNQNNWAQCLTVAELKKVWDQGSTINNWKDVRAGFPDVPLKLYGPGTDSGTFDYFTEVINGKAKQSRPDFQASEDDNVLVQGIAGDRGALGYFGYAYYVENKDKLKLVAVDNGKGCVSPSDQTVRDGTYSPLSRPIFIYVKKSSLMTKPEVRAFANYYITEGQKLIPQVGYILSPAKVYEEDLKKLADVK